MLCFMNISVSLTSYTGILVVVLYIQTNRWTLTPGSLSCTWTSCVSSDPRKSTTTSNWTRDTDLSKPWRWVTSLSPGDKTLIESVWRICGKLICVSSFYESSLKNALYLINVSMYCYKTYVCAQVSVFKLCRSVGDTRIQRPQRTYWRKQETSRGHLESFWR